MIFWVNAGKKSDEHLGGAMPFSIIQNDLIQMKTDAIVNATDQYYSGGGGVDYAIHRAAGPELFEDCGYLGRLHLGEAKATRGYNLPVKYIIHTSGPHWRGGSSQEFSLLENCYKNSINLARTKNCKSISFPLISSKGKRFPKETALIIAINAINKALYHNDDIDVFLVVFTKHEKTLSKNLFPEIQQIIENDYNPTNDYIEEMVQHFSETNESKQTIVKPFETRPEENLDSEEYTPLSDTSKAPKRDNPDINKLIEQLLSHPTKKNLDKVPIDESFAQMLARILENKRVKHTSIYDELGMSNVGFWKILKGKSNPSKMTVFGLAIALHLTIEETREMLMRAGYSINPSSLQDVIIAGLIKNEVYDRYAIDNLLYALDLQLLPGAIID